MITDQNKGITNILYNHLNLPAKILFGAETRKIEYLYTAGGKKVRKAIKSRDLFESGLVDYLDGFQYKDGNLQFFPTSEGYVRATDVNGTIAYSYVYNYTDHLGNIRLSYAKDPENPNVLKILEEDHYYPFGLKHTNYNSDLLVHREYRGALGIKDPVTPEPLVPVLPYNYKYNGKELQDELGLNMFDYGARNYDPTIGRWVNIDPKADNYQEYSPYNYVLNNPMFYIDPNGEDVFLFYSLSNNYHKGEKDKDADSMFWISAITRGLDMLKSGEIGEGDIAIFRKIDNMNDIKEAVEEDVANNQEKYGKTAEFGLWSHGGASGPFRENASGSFDQLSPSDWGEINFNWGENAKAVFYGCRTGRTGPKQEAEYGKSFSQLVSDQANMKNTNIWGQTAKSWPSPFTNARLSTGKIKDGIHLYPTYMVGSDKSLVQRVNTTLGYPTYARPMAVYKNGALIKFEHQPGKKY